MKLDSFCLRTLAICSVVSGLATVAYAQRPMGVRALFVEEIRNDRAPFMVRVAVDRLDCFYHVGDTVTAGVISEQAGYLYLFYVQADDQIAVVFPNNVQQDNLIPAKQVVTVPAANAQFRFRVGEPVGKEILKAVVSKKRLTGAQVDAFRNNRATSISGATARALYVEQLRDLPAEWAEHSVELTTAKPGAVCDTKLRRIAVCVGISNYRDKRIRPLSICHKDAEAVADVLQKRCGVQHVILLTNEQATRARIEEVIRQELAELTRPGDEIFIYWSGHGSRVADDNNDEQDGVDETMVPYDADMTNVDSIRRTFVVDDAFGRWIQGLDGRKVLVVADTCHSGGQANQEKGVTALGVEVAGNKELDFLDKEFNRAKDLGQKDAALLASSTARQISYERSDGNLSAMTYFMVEQLGKAPGRVTLSDMYQHLAQSVPAYVSQTFPGTTQTPVLIDDITPPFFVKP